MAGGWVSLGGLVWGGGFGGEEGGGGPFAFVGFGHGGWWGKVRVEVGVEVASGWY